MADSSSDSKDSRGGASSGSSGGTSIGSSDSSNGTSNRYPAAHGDAGQMAAATPLPASTASPPCWQYTWVVCHPGLLLCQLHCLQQAAAARAHFPHPGVDSMPEKQQNTLQVNWDILPASAALGPDATGLQAGSPTHSYMYHCCSMAAHLRRHAGSVAKAAEEPPGPCTKHTAMRGALNSRQTLAECSAAISQAQMAQHATAY